MDVDTEAAISRQSIHSLNTNHQRQHSATGLLLRLADDAVVEIQVGNQTKLFKTICGTRELSITVWTWVDLGIFWKWIARTTHTTIHSIEDLPISVQLQKLLLTPFSNQISGRWGYHSLPHPPNLKSGKSLKTLCNPSHFRAQIETTLGQMEIEGSLGKTDFDHCKWATPIDPVIRPDGIVRICWDCKVTLNTCLHVSQQPLPWIQDCFQAVKEGQKLSKDRPLTSPWQPMAPTNPQGPTAEQGPTRCKEWLARCYCCRADAVLSLMRWPTIEPSLEYVST